MNRLGVKEIEQILPHRHPFLLVDYIEDYEPGKFAVGYKCVTFREDFFKGHFPAHNPQYNPKKKRMSVRKNLLNFFYT